MTPFPSGNLEPLRSCSLGKKAMPFSGFFALDHES